MAILIHKLKENGNSIDKRYDTPRTRFTLPTSLSNNGFILFTMGHEKYTSPPPPGGRPR